MPDVICTGCGWFASYDRVGVATPCVNCRRCICDECQQRGGPGLTIGPEEVTNTSAFTWTVNQASVTEPPPWTTAIEVPVEEREEDMPVTEAWQNFLTSGQRGALTRALNQYGMRIPTDAAFMLAKFYRLIDPTKVTIQHPPSVLDPHDLGAVERSLNNEWGGRPSFLIPCRGTRESIYFRHPATNPPADVMMAQHRYQAWLNTRGISFETGVCGERCSTQEKLLLVVHREDGDTESYCLACMRYAGLHECMDCYRVGAHEVWAGRYICGECTPRCYDCGDQLDSDELGLFPSGEPYCRECGSEYHTACNTCGVWIINDDVHFVDDEMDGPPYCFRCVRDARRRDLAGRETVCRAEPSVYPVGPTFGVEIEATFPDGDCPTIGAWHSFFEAEPPMLSNWRAESDSSITRGGEFISPVLRGRDGVAEVLAAYEIMDELGASVEQAMCGQHIHLGRGDVEWLKVQAVMARLEDIALAVTGSIRRWQSGYARRIKSESVGRYMTEASNDLPRWMESGLPLGNHSVVDLAEQGTYEFRYPPGTLIGEQFVINLSLINLVHQIASELDDAGVTAILRHNQGFCRRVDSEADNAALLHDAALDGARFLRTQGWHIGGRWRGCLYDLSAGGEVRVVDERRNQFRVVELPTEREVYRRLKRQLRHFYNRAVKQYRWWSAEEARDKADEVLSIFA